MGAAVLGFVGASFSSRIIATQATAASQAKASSYKKYLLFVGAGFSLRTTLTP